MEPVVIGKPRKSIRSGSPLLGILLLLVFLPYILIFGLWILLWGLMLRVAIWSSWGGRDVLLVYSDSPTWKEYFETEIIPLIRSRAVILNWSDRRNWKNSLAVLAYRHFINHRDFNPVALVFRPLRSVRKFRYFQAFQDHKRGDPAEVERISRELFENLGIG